MEIQASAQEVERDGNHVTVKLTAGAPQPPARQFKLRFAEPVEVPAGSTVVIEIRWPASLEPSVSDGFPVTAVSVLSHATLFGVDPRLPDSHYMLAVEPDPPA